MMEVGGTVIHSPMTRVQPPSFVVPHSSKG
jgi:hypothetical protein